MSIFRSKRSAPTFSEPPIPAYPGAAIGGSYSRNPSVTEALQLSAVWACVRLVADTVSMMPLHTFAMRGGIRVPVDDIPFVHSPSSDATMSEWVYMAVVALMLRGNVLGRIVDFDTNATPKTIELYAPDTVGMRVDPNTGQIVYKTQTSTIPNREMFHLRAYRMPGSKVGLSPIQYASGVIGRERAIQDFSLGYFTDAPHPQAVLTSDQAIDDVQARSIKERLISRVQGREPLILGAGLNYRALSVTPEESQFLQTQKLGTAEIARIFGVPPEMIAAEAGNAMTYANIEQRGIDFLTYSIQPWLTRLENAISAFLPNTRHVRFDTSVLTRTDMETLAKASAIRIASKQLTPDESRELFDMPPLTSAQKDVLDLVPLEILPTGNPKLVPPLAPAKDPVAPAAPDASPPAK